jgi:hypothetical protein
MELHFKDWRDKSYLSKFVYVIAADKKTKCGQFTTPDSVHVNAISTYQYIKSKAKLQKITQF